jgi:hypothetical protein
VSLFDVAPHSGHPPYSQIEKVESVRYEPKSCGVTTLSKEEWLSSADLEGYLDRIAVGVVLAPPRA